jgi:hypothetical protein
VLVLFQAADVQHPDKVRDVLINDRQVLKVECVFTTTGAGGDVFEMPDGAIIHLADKSRLRVKQTPREVQYAFRAGGGR